jgi:hypothetical protein
MRHALCDMSSARLSKMPLAVTTSLCRFLADYFFASKKEIPMGHIRDIQIR